jgi:hypothetical protein
MEFDDDYFPDMESEAPPMPEFDDEGTCPAGAD